jgi:hypothetical protein
MPLFGRLCQPSDSALTLHCTWRKQMNSSGRWRKHKILGLDDLFVKVDDSIFSFAYQFSSDDRLVLHAIPCSSARPIRSALPQQTPSQDGEFEKAVASLPRVGPTTEYGAFIGIDMNGLMQSQASPLVLTALMTVQRSCRTPLSPVKSRGRGSSE